MPAQIALSGPTRKDAVARRTALLDAAIDCIEAHGYAVPLEEIADRAGVGRATLYRNFKDRVALALAIFAREIDQLVPPETLELPFEDALRRIVRDGARMSALFARLLAEVQLDEAQLAAFRQLGLRAERALEPLVARAHAEGRLRPDVGAQELLMVVRMLGALCKPFKEEDEIAEMVTTGLTLLLHGIAPR
ncbi:TetR family transcriptional regulator [Novosphingobium sp. FSY-8]|uniref:TetR family transcriptional regulator n=1 Tax=Novosphingobium ovatum TaxID=1908523 RepID=A0ABW9XHS6_9SPHN|nr:TetR/AcrR family transcriptional regulator [Novosphingobium ovatum]NBC38130.1 TetR family transcriptional regulator [Novosphingobium ovatum]